MFNLLKRNRTKKKAIQGWGEERVRVAVHQRNFLLAMVMTAFIALFVALFTLFVVTKSRNIEPFIIEVEKKSGIATIVNPATVLEYSSNRTLSNYFIIEYIKARELFNPTTYEYYYYTYVRLFSSADVYSAFRSLLYLSSKSSPINLYNNVRSSEIKVRSIQYIAPQSVQLRFTLEFTDSNSKVIKKNKIATVGFEYMALNLNEAERYTNPLGFVVNSYQINDDYA